MPYHPYPPKPIPKPIEKPVEVPLEVKPREENKSLRVAELMGKMLRPSASSDEETLRMVAQYSLQISPRQQMTINRMQVTAMDERVPLAKRNTITQFLSDWMETKRYHDTMPFIVGTVDSLSLRKFWSNDSMKGNITKMG